MVTDHDLIVFFLGVAVGVTSGYLFDRFILRRLVDWRAAWLRRHGE